MAAGSSGVPLRYYPLKPASLNRLVDSSASSARKIRKFDRLQVVFKVAERCNINCDYCYYFNMGDDSALGRPPTVAIASSIKIADWLAEGCVDLGISRLSISFHGGEPMLLKPMKFDEICTALSERLSSVVDLSYNMQTNGTILSDAWIDVLSKHRIHLGFSIDGDRTAHDRHRLDHRARSTFDQTATNLNTMLDKAASGQEYFGPATISVLDSRNNNAHVFDFLAKLGITRMSFLLPDRSHDRQFTGGHDSAIAYGHALFDIFQAWLINDDSRLFVRYISEFISNFQLAKTASQEDKPAFAKDNGKLPYVNQVIIVHSDGKVGVNDSYIPALLWFQKAPEYSVHTSTLRDFLSDPIFDEIENAIATTAPKCNVCKWKNVCQGGDLENRYSSRNGFENPSVYCDGLMYFYEMASDLLVENGYPRDLIESAISA